jgi:hypothetical protein
MIQNENDPYAANQMTAISMDPMQGQCAMGSSYIDARNDMVSTENLKVASMNFQSF